MFNYLTLIPPYSTLFLAPTMLNPRFVCYQSPCQQTKLAFNPLASVSPKLWLKQRNMHHHGAVLSKNNIFPLSPPYIAPTKLDPRFVCPESPYQQTKRRFSTLTSVSQKLWPMFWNQFFEKCSKKAPNWSVDPLCLSLPPSLASFHQEDSSINKTSVSSAL